MVKETSYVQVEMFSFKTNLFLPSNMQGTVSPNIDFVIYASLGKNSK